MCCLHIYLALLIAHSKIIFYKSKEKSLQDKEKSLQSAHTQTNEDKKMNTIIIRTPYDAGVPFKTSSVKAAVEFLLHKPQYHIEASASIVTAIEAALPFAREQNAAERAAIKAANKASNDAYVASTRIEFDALVETVKDFENKEMNSIAFFDLESVYLNCRMNCGKKDKERAIAAAPKKMALIKPFLDALNENLAVIDSQDYRSEVEDAKRLQRTLKKYADTYSLYC